MSGWWYQINTGNTTAVKLIADLRDAADRGRGRSRPAACLLAAPDERAPESHLSGLRASNTW